MSEHDGSDTGFDEADIRSVAAKLASLDLTSAEMAALVALVTDDDEVIGHALGFDVRASFKSELSGLRPRGFSTGFRDNGPSGS